MATVLKPKRATPLPANPEIVTKHNRPHVRVRDGGKWVLYPVTKNGKGYLRPSKKWYGQFRNALGVVKLVPLSTNKDAAQMMLQELVRDVELERAGCKDAYASHRKTTLATHVVDWLGVLTARGRDAEYTALKNARVTAVFGGCGFVLPGDLDPGRVERFLESLRTGRKKLSVQTTNDYLQAVSQFGKWMAENDRLPKNPFASVKKGNAERDRRYVRRVLDVPELSALMRAARTAPSFRKLSGPDRAMLYAVAAYTGYRAGEMAALTPAAFSLAGGHRSIDLDGAFTKNGKKAAQPVPESLAAELRVYLAGRPQAFPVWPGTWADRAAVMIQTDAEIAGLALTVETKDGPEVLDFHSLRGTYATILDGLNVSLKVRQELMRHSDPRLTMNRYTRARQQDLSLAADLFPCLPSADAEVGAESTPPRLEVRDGGRRADFGCTAGCTRGR